MTLQLAIIGMPQSGKTTVFNALTGSQAATGGFSTGNEEPNLATVKVPDARLGVLAEMFNPKKITHADVQYLDVAGVGKGLAESGLGGQLLGYLQETDALILVVRAFEADDVPHPENSVDPIRDLETLMLEFSFSDLAIVEKRLERIDRLIPKLRGAERDAHTTEREVLLRCKAALENGEPLRSLTFDAEESRRIRGFGFLTLKPVLVLFNLNDDQLGDYAGELLAASQEQVSAAGVKVDALAGEIEMEIGQLEASDAEAFLADLGIDESSRDRVIRLSYDLLGLITYLTTGPQEVRAWAIRSGASAVEAAGEIHTDIARGFIRAEIVRYDDLVRSGGMKESRDAGLLRVEGKEYIMQDGDVTHFLFNV